MLLRRIPLIAVAVIFAVFALFAMLELFATAVPVSAGVEKQVAASAADPVLQAKPEPLPPIIVVSTDVLNVDLFDLSGAILGEGLHFGKLKCNGENCSQRMTVVLEEREYQFKFSTRQALDEVARRVIVQGTGVVTTDTVALGRDKARFSFTAVFQDNQDGTVATTYEASRPDASFSIPRTPGTFKIGR